MEEWVNVGAVLKLEMLVLQGKHDLLKNINKIWNEESRNFVKQVPDIVVGYRNVTNTRRS